MLGDRQVPLAGADALVGAAPLHQQLPLGAEHPAVDGAVQQAWRAWGGGAGGSRRERLGAFGEAASRGSVRARRECRPPRPSPSRWHTLRSWRPMTRSCSSTRSNHSPSSSARAAAAAVVSAAAASAGAIGGGGGEQLGKLSGDRVAIRHPGPAWCWLGLRGEAQASSGEWASERSGAGLVCSGELLWMRAQALQAIPRVGASN